MSQLTVIARMKAQPDAAEKVKEEMLRLLAPTRGEPGCINYDLHQDNEDPSVFFFHENWESAEHLDRHLQSEHIAAFREAAGDLLEEGKISRLTRIG